MTKLPHLYSKLLEMIEGTSERGKTDTDRLRVDVVRKFRLTKSDMKTCLGELKKKNVLTLKLSKNHRPLVMIK
jgi:hypothetical protein